MTTTKPNNIEYGGATGAANACSQRSLMQITPNSNNTMNTNDYILPVPAGPRPTIYSPANPPPPASPTSCGVAPPPEAPSGSIADLARRCPDPGGSQGGIPSFPALAQIGERCGPAAPYKPPSFGPPHTNKLSPESPPAPPFLPMPTVGGRNQKRKTHKNMNNVKYKIKSTPYMELSDMQKAQCWLFNRSFLEDLLEINPNPTPLSTPKAYLEKLFPPGSMACIGIDYATCKTAPLSEFGDLWGARCMVPTPMIAREGLTQGNLQRGIEPHLSARSNANTGRPLYVVYRCTVGGHEFQARVITLFARMARLAMVVEASEYCLEAWYFVGDWPARKVKSFRAELTRYGSRRGTRVACQPYSMPRGLKLYHDGLYDLDKGAKDAPRFEVLYFAPPEFEPVGLVQKPTANVQ